MCVFVFSHELVSPIGMLQGHKDPRTTELGVRGFRFIGFFFKKKKEKKKGKNTAKRKKERQSDRDREASL